jgi:hypothetical protein
LHDDKGRITLPGSYDPVVEPTGLARVKLAALLYTDEDCLARSRTRSACGEQGYTAPERLWARPAAECPACSPATPGRCHPRYDAACRQPSIRIRALPDQKVADVAEQLHCWVAGYHRRRRRIPADRLRAEPRRSPYRTSPDHWAVTALAEAMAEGFGRPVGRMGNAGGPVELLADELARGPLARQR